MRSELDRKVSTHFGMLFLLSSLPRGTLIGKSHLCSPLEQLRAAIIMRNLALNEDGSTPMSASLFDRLGQFFARSCPQARSLSVFCIENRDQTSVIPICSTSSLETSQGFQKRNDG